MLVHVWAQVLVLHMCVVWCAGVQVCQILECFGVLWCDACYGVVCVIECCGGLVGVWRYWHHCPHTAQCTVKLPHAHHMCNL